MTTGTPEASASGTTLDPARRLAQALAEEAEVVAREVEGLGQLEADRALFFLLSAYDIATEMWFQKGDPTAPVLTNWELPWRKYGGDNPTTIYLSAPVSPTLRYQLRGPIGDAVYAGLQVYTKGPGFNAPSANISDTRLLRGGPEIDLLIGGHDPGDGTPWIPLVADDYLVMVRLYHRQVPGVVPPPISLTCLDAAPGTGPSLTQRADEAEAFFRDCVLSTMSVTEVLRQAGVNGYPNRMPPSTNPVTPELCSPPSTTSTTASTSACNPARPCDCAETRRRPDSAHSCSTTAGSTPPTSRPTAVSSPGKMFNSKPTGATR